MHAWINRRGEWRLRTSRSDTSKNFCLMLLAIDSTVEVPLSQLRVDRFRYSLSFVRWQHDVAAVHCP